MQERLRWQQSGTVHLGRDFLGCCSEANSGAEVTGKILCIPGDWSYQCSRRGYGDVLTIYIYNYTMQARLRWQ
jgi:hypothetical protein